MPRVERLVYELLGALGENPDRPGLADTPRRVAGMWKEFLDYRDGNTYASFDEMIHSRMVVVQGIKVWSLCEHHLMPFWCELAIGYVPQNGRVLGLSKFARIAHQAAHKLQLQERLVQDVADAFRWRGMGDVVVMGKGEHLCMSMRGAKTPALMSNLSTEGQFKRPEMLAEFFNLLRV